MEGAPDDPDPNMKVHYFATAVVHELIQRLIENEHDNFIDDLPKGAQDQGKA